MISFARLYHVSCVTYSMKKQGMALCKMMNPKNKRQWHPSQTFEDSLPTIKSLTKVKYESGKRSQRRNAMLNKIFMKQITDLMSTGTVSMDIVGRGIEVSKVNVSPDFKTVSVFWVCKGDASDDETEEILNKVAGALRHELSTLRIMGEIPYIVFVKDKQESHIVDLDRRLSLADFGEDFTPTEMGHLLKSEFTLNTKISPEVKAKIKQLEDDLPIVEDPVPEMTHNVYGLDHARIMSRLIAARKKTRDAWTSLDTDSDVISYRATPDTQPDISVSNQRKELADFLLKRQIMQKKIQKQLQSSRDDWQLHLNNNEFDPAYEYTEEDDDEEYSEENWEEPDTEADDARSKLQT